MNKLLENMFFLGVSLPVGQGRSPAHIRLAHSKSLQDSTLGFRWSPPPVAGSKHRAAPHIRLRPHTNKAIKSYKQ